MGEEAITQAYILKTNHPYITIRTKELRDLNRTIKLVLIS